MACGSSQCCSFPQGRLAVQAMLWGIFAYLFCASATTGCYFMKINGFLMTQEPYSILNKVGTSTIGPFGFEGIDSNGVAYCLQYSQAQIDNFMDSSWRTARVFAVLANLFNGISLMFLFTLACVKYNQIALNVFAAFSIAGSVSAWCVFSFFGSRITEYPYDGSFFWGAGMGLVGALASMITAYLILQIPQEPNVRNWRVVPPPNNNNNNNSLSQTTPIGKRNFPSPKKRSNPQETSLSQPYIAADPEEAFAPGTETITETIMPDGSKKNTKTVVDFDGTKTVTETIVKEEMN